MLKKTKPVFPSRTTRSNGSPEGVFSITSWLEDAFNGSGRAAEFLQINPIELGSGPRRSLLRTRIVKKELGPTSKRKVSSFDSCVPELIPLSRSKSRSIATFPVATTILSRVPVCPSGFSRGLWCRISRAVAQKQKQRERKITQHFLEHCPNPPIDNPFRR